MTLDWWLTYLLTTLILSLSPGSGAINTMSTAISHGTRGVVASIGGLQLGLAVHIVLVGVGLGALVSQSLLAFEILKWLGAAYLIWLGIQQWRAAGSLDLHALANSMPRRKLFKRAVFVNLTNPKSIVFSGRVISTICTATATAGGTVFDFGQHQCDCRYYRDDWLCHFGYTYCPLD